MLDPLANLRANREKKAAAEKKKVQAKIKLTNDVLYYGLLQSENQVNDLLRSGEISHGAKIEALKAQLHFRKDVLGQKASDSKLYNVTVQVGPKKRRNLSAKELGVNIIKLIEEAMESARMQTEEEEGNPRLLKKRIQHCFDVDGEKRWYTGTVVSKARCVQVLS